MPLRQLKDHWHDVAGSRVLLRVDLNVPLGPDYQVLCDYRIRRVIGLVSMLSRLGCRVIMVSHLGRPHGRPTPELSLAPFVARFARQLEPPVSFLPAWSGPQIERRVNTSPPGSVFLMENLRFHPGEEAADFEFGNQLARLGDCFVNDAFSVSHRAHASTVVLPQLLPAFAGPAFTNEYIRAQQLVKTIRPPVVVLSGGLKLDKLLIYQNLLPHIDSLLLGSGFAGRLMQDPGLLGDPERAQRVIVSPPDLYVSEQDSGQKVVRLENLHSGLRPIDIGPEAVNLFCRKIASAGTVLFNGSPGALPVDDPRSSLDPLLRTFVSSKAVKVVCGGTGCSLFIESHLARHVNFIFPGGGAILAFLDGQANPAIPHLAYNAYLEALRAAPAFQRPLQAVGPAPTQK